MKAISSLDIVCGQKMMHKSLDPFGLDFGDFDQLQLIQGHFVPLQNVWVHVKAK